MLAATGAVLLVCALAVAALGGGLWALLPVVPGAWMLVSAATFLYATRAGKFAVWAELLRGLRLRGDERLLDLGCGRGAVLLMAARMLPRGRAVGIDLWRTVDQSGNAMEATRRNAELEGVADCVELHTGDMRELPFEGASFDVVVSSLAIHNIRDGNGRRRAIEEAARVLAPGGRLLIVDIAATDHYVTWLRAAGLTDVERRPLGWRFWYGGPWVSGTLVSATRDGAG